MIHDTGKDILEGNGEARVEEGKGVAGGEGGRAGVVGTLWVDVGTTGDYQKI